MSVYQRWVLNVLLHDICVVLLHDRWRFPDSNLCILCLVFIASVRTLISTAIRASIVKCLMWCTLDSVRIVLSCVIVLLCLDVLMVLLLKYLQLSIKSQPELFNLLEDVDAPALWWGFWLANEHYKRTWCQALLGLDWGSIRLVLIVFIDIIEVCWVEPS